MENFYRELLNVEGKFQADNSKTMLNLKEHISAGLQEQQSILKTDNEINELLSQMERLASQKDMDISKDVEAFHNIRVESKKLCDSPSLHLKFNDADMLFLQYCEEAHKAGFKDTKIEELLTLHELQMSDILEEKIDQLFDLRTTLRGKEIAILSCAIIARVWCLKMVQYDLEDKLVEQKKKAINAMPELKKNSEKIMSIADSSKEAIDLLEQVGGGGTVRSPEEIMQGRVPFDIEKYGTMSKSDILGYSPGIGWLIGIINILTGTITKNNFESFFVDMSDDDSYTLLESVNISSLIPRVLYATKTQKDSIYYSVLREAKIQGCHIAEGHEIKYIVEQMENIERTKGDSIGIKRLFDMWKEKFEDLHIDSVKELAKIQINQMLDKMITYICAVQYDSKSDGDLADYIVRITQVLSLSAAAAAILVKADVENANLGGLLVYCEEEIKSSKFWINAKVEYLEKIHGKILSEIEKMCEQMLL